MKIVLNLVGIAAVLAICWLISWNRKRRLQRHSWQSLLSH